MIESNEFLSVYGKSNDKEKLNSLNPVKSANSNNKNNDKTTALIKQITAAVKESHLVCLFRFLQLKLKCSA